MKSIKVFNARVHNLKNVSIEIPRNKITVMSGVSGSGKSSLAFETIYKEGQKRFFETISQSSSQILGQLGPVEVDDITGLTPTIAIDQKSQVKNPRSTVGTLTDIYDFIRILYAQLGRPYYKGRAIQAFGKEELIQYCQKIKKGQKLIILAPIIKKQRGRHDITLAKYQSLGYSRLRVNGEYFEFDDKLPMSRNKLSSVELVIDRIIIKESNNDRMIKSLLLALKIGQGHLLLDIDGKIEFLSENYVHPETNEALPSLSPRIFSFNSPDGACPHCQGLGSVPKISSYNYLCYRHLSLLDNPINLVFEKFPDLERLTRNFYKKRKYDFNLSIEELPDQLINELIDGNDDYKGLNHYLHNILSEYELDTLEQCYHLTKCNACEGSRLNEFARSIYFNKKNIAQIIQMSLDELYSFFNSTPAQLKKNEVYQKISAEIQSRLHYLIEVGVSYLNLNRGSQTLSGGELQRIRLANQLGTQLSGVIYILDEPSIGLHQRDNQRLIKILEKLCQQGNTLIVVEHDEDTMRAADYIIDIGPRSGEDGGKVIYQGHFNKFLKCSDSLTAQYLAGDLKIFLPNQRRKIHKKIKLTGACENNINNLTCELPLEVLTCVSGVSGSGKSTLFNNILIPAIQAQLNRQKIAKNNFKKLEGVEHIQSLINIDQSPIGRSAKSIPATYVGIFDKIRQLFAATIEAKAQGLSTAHFSFNTAKGRCPSCEGHGYLKSEIPLLNDVYNLCQTCHGSRYQEKVKKVLYKGLSIAHILDLTIDQAVDFFEHHRKLHFTLKTMKDVGLGYLKIGQPTPTLSGGEAQRLKLSKELAKIKKGHCLYFLDEPSTGLHFHDIQLLLNSLQKLVDQGNTVVVIEHNLDILKVADHIIDLGPEGGVNGGKIVAQGTPEEVAKDKKSLTGTYLKTILKNSKALN